MAVAFNNSDVRLTAGGTTVSFSYVSSSGADRLLLTQSFQTASIAVTGVTFFGQALTNVDSNGNLLTWRKTAPATGSNTLSFTLASYGALFVSTADFTGVDQTTPIGAAVNGNGTSASPATGSITVPANGMAWAGMHGDYSTSTPTIASGTLAGAIRDGGSGNTAAGAYRSTTGTLGWNISGGLWYAQGFPINAVPVSFPAELLKRGSNFDTTLRM